MKPYDGDLENEIWKDIPNIPNYQVSNMGRIRFLYHDKWKLASIKIKKGKRATLVLSNNKEYGIARLVATAFIQNKENKPFVYHLDNDSLNNKVENLIWMTTKEGENYLISHGLKECSYKVQQKPVIVIDEKGNEIEYKSMSETIKNLDLSSYDELYSAINNEKKLNGKRFKFKDSKKTSRRVLNKRTDFNNFDGRNYDLVDLFNEEWERLFEWPNYFISNCGRVKFDDGKDKYIVKQFLLSNYAKCYVYKNNDKSTRKTLNIAREVGKAFHKDTYKQKLVINHIDAEPLNNHSDNLEWITQKENSIHAVKMGLTKKANFKCAHHVKVIFEDGREEIFATIEECHKKLGISIKFIYANLDTGKFHSIKKCKLENLNISYEAYLEYKKSTKH